MDKGSAEAASNLRFVIIGAGMAGLLAGVRLKQRGDTNFVIYEKGDSVGGTWRENSYPGLSCDTPAHSYAYSFEFNPDWSAFYAPGPEIKRYFEGVAAKYEIYEHIQFGTEVVAGDYQAGQWHIETSRGQRDVADVLIAASGVLHHPNVPDIPGLADFKGPAFHSARWDHSIDMTDKVVGVIGAGSTGVQIVSALAGRSAGVTHLMRTPQWIMPCPDLKYSDEERAAFRSDPSLIENIRSGPEAQARRGRFLAAIVDKNSPELKEIQAVVENNLEDSIKDPELREKLRPNYVAACKRLVFSPHYYDAVQKPGVTVETGGIERVTADGIRMRDGSFHRLDVIVLATGFKVDQFVRPMKITGRDGADLDKFWQPNPRAYYAVTVPEFPNFYLLNGPTGPVGNFSLVDIAERQFNYMDQLVELQRQGKAKEISVKAEALASYEGRRDAQAMNTVFAAGCQSWYLDAKGVPQVWPWPYEYFMEVMDQPKLDDYEIR